MGFPIRHNGYTYKSISDTRVGRSAASSHEDVPVGEGLKRVQRKIDPREQTITSNSRHLGLEHQFHLSCTRTSCIEPRTRR